MLEVSVKRIDPGVPLPSYAHVGDAGLDLYSTINAVLRPFERLLIPTGIAIEIPNGFAGFVQPRSGLAIRHGFSLVNTPGLIDSHYRGEIKVIAINLDPNASFEIKRGDKIAQLVIQAVEHVRLVPVEELSVTVRGEGGFGSTGV